ncbi:MAG: helix-hairpin-helix domain-containing protein [Solirubrobacterales bacterium]|nr:helix-hairpin-helix domain-containing protein [Solirubrobacterales bacterium]
MGKWDRGTVLIWGACGVLTLGLGGKWLVGQGSGGASSASGEGSGQTTQARSTTPVGQAVAIAGTPVLVHVVGAVRRPGVYRLSFGARVFQAIRAAGGAAAGADPNRIDLAAGSAGAGGSQASGPVSLSTASAADLDRLDGIGPALAARIIQWRDANGGFRSVNDLDRVSGIGPAKLLALRNQVVP